jgi:hypothetical protein
VDLGFRFHVAESFRFAERKFEIEINKIIKVNDNNNKGGKIKKKEKKSRRGNYFRERGKSGMGIHLATV